MFTLQKPRVSNMASLREIESYFLCEESLISVNVFTTLTFMGPCIVIIFLYIQQDATLHSLFYLETALHVAGGTITYHQERKQLYLQHLVFVTLLLLPAARGR
jgi:hypothetical protein